MPHKIAGGDVGAGDTARAQERLAASIGPRGWFRGKTWAPLLLLLCLVLAGCAAQAAHEAVPAAAPLPTPELCAPGGVCALPEFAAFYRVHAALLGPPLSGGLRLRGRVVQYFRAGRLELVPENPPEWRVGLAYLGEETCGRQPPLDLASVPASYQRDVRYFPGTGHSLRGDFLRFVDENGGVGFFGEPISEQRAVGSERVQDFVRVQLRQRSDGSFYLANLGELAWLGRNPPEGMCPGVPADLTGLGLPRAVANPSQ